MALSLQEISDRLEIQDLIYNYSAIIDQKRFDDLREVFTEDAQITVDGDTATGRVMCFNPRKVDAAHRPRGYVPPLNSDATFQRGELAGTDTGEINLLEKGLSSFWRG